MKQPATISFGEWTLHRNTGELERDGKRVRIPDQAHHILEELLARPSELVTREQLIARLWPSGVVDFEASLNAAVRKLRSLLNDEAEKPQYIETVPRKGYRFVGTIESFATETVVLPAPKSRRPVIAIVVLAMLGLIAWYAMRPPAPASARVRLAVMPFENLSPDPDNAFFTHGVYEEVLSTLVNRATEMDVISRTTMMSYKDHPTTVAEIAKSLGVTHVLEGSVRRDGQTVRVSVQLVDARSDRNLWSHSYDRELVNAMTLQSQVASEVTSQLAVKLADPSAQLPPSANPEAYDLYLKAKLASQAIAVATPVAELDKVEGWLTRAIQLDDSFAAAYVERAHLRLFKFGYSHDVSDDNLRAIRADIESARKLSGDVAAVLHAESRYANAVEMNLDKALAIIDRPGMVASRDPAVLRWRGFVLSSTSGTRTDEALRLFESAASLEPGDQANFFNWESALKRLGRPADAIAVARSFNEHGPGRLYYGDVEFSFAGRVERLREDVQQMDKSVDADARLAMWFELLRFERRDAELADLLDHTQMSTIRPGAVRETPIPGIGKKPVAELSGWLHLLTGNKVAAVKQGQIVLEFVAGERTTPWNQWHLRCLAAEGALFSGDKTRAVAEMHAALELLPSGKLVQRRYANVLAARVFAWAGAEDEAVNLLEQLATTPPLLGPAEITRDPLYSIPLAKNARYQSLSKQLEAKLAANARLF
jgi:TolB-like protein/DNA-binding winged helix-turn-helix (wHTH) protein